MGIRVDLYLRELRDLPRDAALGWREQGIRGVGAELRRVTLGQVRWSNRYLIIERRLADVSHADPPAGVRIDAFQGPDWSVLAPIAPARALRAFRERSERGERTCIVAWRDGRPVGYTWLSASIEREIEALPLALPDDAVYGWHLHVAPRSRGAGIGTALVRARLLHARARGFRREWRAIRADNRPAVRTAVKTGGELLVVGTASLTKRLGGTSADYEPCPPRRAELE
jgi:GNAT superfamily N-acetyltransferase